MINGGRSEMLVESYRRGFGSPDKFLMEVSQYGDPSIVTPSLAIALQSAGHESEAEALLRAIEDEVETRIERLPGDVDAIWELALIRAAQKNADAALDS